MSATAHSAQRGRPGLAHSVNERSCVAAVRASLQLEEVQGHIDAQQADVDALVPGTDEHRLASRVLLLLKDSLHLLHEIEALLAATKQRWQLE